MSPTSNANEDARRADEIVDRFRSLQRHAYAMRAPEFDAARASVIVNRDDFDVWYRVQSQIVFGRRPDFRVPAERQCAEAFKRYQEDLDIDY